MPPPTRWNIAPPHPAAEELAARLKTSPLLAQILLNRGLIEPADCTAFLRPNFKTLYPPAGIPGLTRAAERLARAVRDREKIVVYGDYDADGITATAILWHAVQVLGGRAEYYIPHRIDEGYGLNSEAIAQLCDGGAQLIITVDCGITAIEPARVAKERGVDLIITDHHLWKTTGEGGERDAGRGERDAETRGQERDAEKEEDPEGAPTPAFVSASLSPLPASLSSPPLLPDCYAVVHPRLRHDGPAYANPHLCGAGVALKLAWGAGQAVGGGEKVGDAFRDYLIQATGLAALGTIADVVPLVGENRVLAHFGLAGLEKSSLRGIKALIASAGLTGTKLDSYHVGFCLGPRLNACGRMGHAREAVEMLTTADEKRAASIAIDLEVQNKHRQALERKITHAALAQAAEYGYDGDDQRAVVLGSADWHPGVIGIVASRLVDRLHRPAVLVALTNGHGTGSGRSIAGFHLARAFEACGEHLASFGGHEMAAGLKLETKNFQDFREAFCHHAKQKITDDMCRAELDLEAAAELRQITQALVADLARLGPFGHANRTPLLALHGVEVYNPRRMGKNMDHLQLNVLQGKTSLRCVAWGMGDLCDDLPPGTKINLAAEPKLNEYQGRVSVELEVKDVQVL